MFCSPYDEARGKEPKNIIQNRQAQRNGEQEGREGTGSEAGEPELGSRAEIVRRRSHGGACCRQTIGINSMVTGASHCRAGI